MGGKSRKTGGISKKLIDRIKNGKSNIASSTGKAKSNGPNYQDVKKENGFGLED